MSLRNYRTLGQSGLIVSPLALGTMTFGESRWGANSVGCRRIFNSYVEAGGNFIDTADVYSGGRSEEMLGAFIEDRGVRHELVVATKAGYSAGASVVAGGNGAKHLQTSINGSLGRLRTDYVDLFWVHVWDSVTPAEELLETMTSIVRAGKARYWGISNAPAWYASKLATLAHLRGSPRPIALQYFYSLVNRDIEYEHVGLARDFGMGILPWSPLAYGLLTGRYDRNVFEAARASAATPGQEVDDARGERPADDKRLNNRDAFGDSLLTPRNWNIADTVRRIAQEAGQAPAGVALAWVNGRPGVASTIMGVSRAEQVADNIAALDVELSPEHRQQLDDISAPEPRVLYSLFTESMRRNEVFCGHSVTDLRH